jgi:predicted enzyme related to lactoylglutathione lyase
MAAPPIGSLLVGSSDPDKLKEWYGRAFSVEADAMGAFDFGGVGLFIESHSDISGPTKEPARIQIDLHVSDCRALEAHLKSVGVNWLREVEQMPFGLIGTVVDPDGNYVQIIEWGANPESHKDA